MLKIKHSEIEIGKLMIIRLSAGEEVIGKVENIDDEFVFLSKPFRPIMTQQGLGIAPFSILSDNDLVPIDLNHIVSYYPPANEVEVQYLQATSGIDLISKIPSISIK